MLCVEQNRDKLDLCRHGMALPQVAGGRTASNMEGSYGVLNQQSRTADKLFTKKAQGRDRWRALVNEVMNIRVP
jgi:hypothetical protein